MKSLKSKKGFTLVEVIATILILSIVVAATASGIAMSKKIITQNAIRDKASAEAQKVADMLVEVMSSRPDGNYIQVENVSDSFISDIAYPGGSVFTSTGARYIEKNSFEEDVYTSNSSDYRVTYTYEYVNNLSTSNIAAGQMMPNINLEGYNITVRVLCGLNGAFGYVTVNAFAPYSAVSTG